MQQEAWHTKDIPEILGILHSNESGLSNAEAAVRLNEHGPNALPEAASPGIFLIFLRQFRSPLIYLLLAASATVFFMGDVSDSIIILAVLLFNSVIGTIQEGRAQNTLSALKRYVKTNATVLRDEQEIVIPDQEVVVGDVLVLQEGDKIPADARVFYANHLKLDEAPLTGESEPVSKIPERVEKPGATAMEQLNMVFKGTSIVSGNGKAIVVATGERTVIGAIAKKIQTIDAEIPLQASVRHLSRAIIGVVGLISVMLFVLGLYKGLGMATIFSTVVALAVSVIPEGLPIVMTLVLATGVWRMSKRNALVKKLQAVEALGQAQVIAVDKTGTITKNELVIREVWTEGKMFSIGGVGYEPRGTVTFEGAVVDAANHPELLFAGKIAALCNAARLYFSEAERAWHIGGDPTEAAIRVFGEKIGFIKDDLERESPLVAEVPFDYRLKYHATAHKIDGKNFLAVQGAPEAILAMCTQIRMNGETRALGKQDREELEVALADMTGRGLRVVAGAVRLNASLPLQPSLVDGLTFVAFSGMQDVLRLEVADAVRSAVSSGIRVVMITGDHKLTALAIAKEAGIARDGDEVLTGEDIDRLSDGQLAEKLTHVAVFARVTPEHKLRIITAYKNRGEIVAMTGDGVNDAPSLVAADLGVAMGKIGTEVAKEAADIVLLDDNFGSIVAAIEEGRSIYRTIKKVLLYLFSTSAGEVFVIAGALLLGLPLPIVAAQIIWLNFVTDGFLDVALAMEPKEPGLLAGTFKRPPRYLVDWAMVRRMMLMALPMTIGTLLLFKGYVDGDIAKAGTMALTLLAVFQWFNAWNCRSESESVFRSKIFSNMYLFCATVVVVSLQLLAVYNPTLQKLLHTVPLSLAEWGIVITIAASIVVVEEVRKFAYRVNARPRSAPAQ